MIYCTNNPSINKSIIIENGFRDLDRLFDMSEVYFNEGSGDSIISRIISKLQDMIIWVMEKIKDLRDKTVDFFENKIFAKKASSIDPVDVLRLQRPVKFTWYDKNKIKDDVVKKMTQLRKDIDDYKRYFEKYINTGDVESIKNNKDIAFDNYNLDVIGNHTSPQGLRTSDSNPEFGVMFKHLENMDPEYTKSISYSNQQIKDIIEKARNVSSEPDAAKILGIDQDKGFDIDIRTLEFLKKELKEIDETGKKVMARDAKKSKDDNLFSGYKIFERYTKNLCKQIEYAIKVINWTNAHCKTYKMSDKFFNVIVKHIEESKDGTVDIDKLQQDLQDAKESAFVEVACDIIDRRNMEALSEAYIGKTKTLLEIEEQIGIVREKALKKFTDIDKSPEMLKLNRLFEKQFGMDCFALCVDQCSTINAYTFVIQDRFDIALKKNISNYVEGNTETGYRFKKDNGLCIGAVVYYGLFADEAFTNGELLATILHEIGHNFADAVYDDIKYQNTALMYQFLIMLIYRTIITFGLSLPVNVGTYIDWTNKEHMKQGKKTHRRLMTGLITGIASSLQDTSDFISGVLTRLKGGKNIEAYKRRMNRTSVKKDMYTDLGRVNEVIADKFATIYGYGPELISALNKMNNYESDAERFVKKIPFIGEKANEAFNISLIDINEYDVHPHNIQRANEALNVLKRELKKADLDPKMRAAIEKQANELEKMINECTKMSKSNASDYEKKKATYNKLINNKYPIGITEELEDKIEEALEKALK